MAKRKKGKPRFDQAEAKLHDGSSIEQRRQMAQEMLAEAKSWYLMVIYEDDQGDSTVTVTAEQIMSLLEELAIAVPKLTALLEQLKARMEADDA